MPANTEAGRLLHTQVNKTIRFSILLSLAEFCEFLWGIGIPEVHIPAKYAPCYQHPPTQRWLQCHMKYCITYITISVFNDWSIMSRRGREFGNPVVSLLLAMSSPHRDNAWFVPDAVRLTNLWKVRYHDASGWRWIESIYKLHRYENLGWRWAWGWGVVPQKIIQISVTEICFQNHNQNYSHILKGSMR